MRPHFLIKNSFLRQYFKCSDFKDSVIDPLGVLRTLFTISIYVIERIMIMPMKPVITNP